MISINDFINANSREELNRLIDQLEIITENCCDYGIRKKQIIKNYFNSYSRNGDVNEFEKAKKVIYEISDVIV